MLLALSSLWEEGSAPAPVTANPAFGLLASISSLWNGTAPLPPPPPTPPQPFVPTADSASILIRLVRLLPSRWWSTPAPVRDAILGGASDVLAQAQAFFAFAAAQMRLSSAVGFWIDLFAFDYLGLTTQRQTGESDTAYAARVRAAITQERVTRSGMISALTTLTGKAPIIIEPFQGSDCGGWSSRTRGVFITGWGWSVGNAADQARAGITSPGGGEIGQKTGFSTSWGSREPTQVWITVFRPSSGQGIANLGGWSNRAVTTNTTGGWSSRIASTISGVLSWVSRTQITGIVTDQDIFDVINLTKPVGVTVWVQLI